MNLYNTAMFTTTHFKRAKKESNPGVLDKSSVTNRLNHGMFFLVMTAYCLVRGPKRFGGSCFRHHFKIYPEDGGNRFVRNVGKLTQGYIKLESRILLCQIVYTTNYIRR
jgi:hypothetical protein